MDVTPRILLATAVAAASPAPVAAQAFTVPRHVGAVTLAWQYIDNTGHRLSDGYNRAAGESVSQSALVEVAVRVGVRKDSPLVIGLGEGEFFIASDVPAFLNYSRDVMFLNDEEMAVITPMGFLVTTLDGTIVAKEVTTITWSPSMAEKGGYRHFMLKEIFEQPRAVSDTVRGRFSLETGEVNTEEFGLSPQGMKEIRKIYIVACGTSWHAGMIGKYLFEEIARVPVEVDIASEFRYRKPLIGPDNLMIVITQSGETADTLAAQREAKKLGARTLTICNVVGSTSAREADAVFYTHSGPEIGVASQHF